MHPREVIRSTAFAAVLAAFVPVTASAQLSFEGPPIDYLGGPVDDPVSRLQKSIDEGEVVLRYDERRGYLPAVLEQLGVPSASQTLVFSKTSFQLKRISPRSPRAVYFGDDVYVGWVRGGEVMEFAAVDPRQGTIFYTLDQAKTSRPKFTRHTHACLQCHSSTLTRGVPGNLVRSVYPAPDGRLDLRHGTMISDHTSPLEERWGGWYVTGKHGAQRHLGNLLVRRADDLENLNTEAGANLTDLRGWFETSSYLTPHSDIVALMVMEHQSQLHNLIMRAGFLTRLARNDDRVINEMMGRPADQVSDSTIRRIRSAGEPLVEYLLFSGEVRLTDPISGTSGFAESFAARGPRDAEGRSLRDFDLKTRLFRYPCSYLIYSEAFDALPPPTRDFVYRRLWEVLKGKEQGEAFGHLSAADRRAILEILLETKPGLPAYWMPDDKPARRAEL